MHAANVFSQQIYSDVACDHSRFEGRNLLRICALCPVVFWVGGWGGKDGRLFWKS